MNAQYASEKFYSVRVDKRSWTKDAVEKEWYERRGATIKESRLVGDYTVFMDGRPVAYLFKNKIDAVLFWGS